MDAVLYILKQFAKGDKDYLIFCEDDIDVNQHFRHNVENWWPVKHDLLDMGSFYNPNVDSHYVDREKHYSLAKPEAFYGSQCIILSRRAVAWVLKNWDTWPARETGTFQDILISRIVAGAHWPIYQHIPSLAEHRSVPSTYGGTVHRSVDYDETFKFIKEGKQNG
jgi:GR25 family glycosyltransferase involved in LPS biosynthesis